jgi:outer membrane protein assembly factor BamA
VTVTIPVSQGARYVVGDVKVSGDVDDLAGYRKLVDFATGQTFARRDIRTAIAGLEAIARDRGAYVETATNVDLERGRVDLELVFHKRGSE